jgi:hypothetical protein
MQASPEKLDAPRAFRVAPLAGNDTSSGKPTPPGGGLRAERLWFGDNQRE